MKLPAILLSCQEGNLCGPRNILPEPRAHSPEQNADLFLSKTNDHSAVKGGS